MSGAGKWVKKNPALAMGLLAVGTGGLGLAGIGPLAALGAGEAAAAGAAGGAAVPLAEGLGAGAAGEMLSAIPATMGDKAATLLGNATYGGGLDKMGQYAKLAGQAQGLLSPQEQPVPQIAPPQLRGPGAPLNPTPMYGGSGGGLYGVDPEEEKRRMYMAYLAQQGVA